VAEFIATDVYELAAFGFVTSSATVVVQACGADAHTVSQSETVAGEKIFQPAGQEFASVDFFTWIPFVT